MLLQADDEMQASEIAAAWLAADIEDNNNVVIIRGQSASVLDSAAQSIGLPKTGGYSTSRWRAPSQLLPLAFDLIWKPRSPRLLLEFLSHPASPIPSKASWHLRKSLAKESGIGERWSKAWSDALQSCREQYVEKGLQSPALEHQLAEDQTSWSTWLTPPQFDPDPGVALSHATLICDSIHRYCSQRAVATSNELFQTAATQAKTVASILAAIGITEIPRIQLQRILDAVLSEATGLFASGAESAPWSLVDSPSRVWGRLILFSGGDLSGHKKPSPHHFGQLKKNHPSRRKELS